MDGIKGFLSRHHNSIALILLLVVSFVTLSTQSRTISSNSKNIGYSIFSSVQNGFARAGLFFSDAFHSLGELRSIRTEYEELQEELIEYRAMERKMIALRKENQELRNLIGFSEKIKYKHIPSRIIAKEPGTLFSGFTIDKGSSDGIAKDMAVTAYTEGFRCLVGKVYEVSKNTAMILPLIDHSSYIAARMLESRYEGLIHGKGTVQSMVEMNYINKQAKDEINFGDLVITSGLRSIYPEDLYIGRVSEIYAPEWETSLTLEIEPIVDFSRLEYVYVLLGESE